MKTLWRYTMQEWQLCCHSRLLRVVLLWIPLVVCAFMALLFSAGSVHQLPVALIDNDQSATSRQLIRFYQSAPALKIRRDFADSAHAYHAMQTVQVYAVIHIPKNYESDLINQRKPSVHVDYNGLYMLSGKTIASALKQAHATFSATLVGAQALSRGQNLQSAKALIQPLRYQLQAMYNMNNNYANILVPSIFIMVWQLALFVATILSLVMSSQRFGLARAFVAHPILRFTAKSIPIFMLSAFSGACCMYYGYRFGHWPLYGSIIPQLIAGGMSIFASISIASLFFWLSKDAVKALGMAGMFAAPALAYMGVTFPQSDMPALAHFWHGLIPSSHLVKIMLHYGHLNAGQPFFAAPYAALLLLGAIFYVLVCIILLAYRQRAAKAEPACSLPAQENHVTGL